MFVNFYNFGKIKRERCLELLARTFSIINSLLTTDALPRIVITYRNPGAQTQYVITLELENGQETTLASIIMTTFDFPVLS